VNIYFPAPEVRRAAEQIVEETWGADAAANPGATKPAKGEDSGWLPRLGPARAYAQDVDINVSTAAIRKLKDSMKSRAEQLKPYLGAGNVGVGKDGMLVVRDLAGVSLRDQAEIRRLVEAENRDRASLYREIAKANDFGPDRVDDIQKIFAETWIGKAERGWPIQKADGSWGKK
jgi:uncharacterized protein YdbL (DUF1318 family)